MAMTKMKAIRMHRYGGPEVLVYEDAPCPEAGPGEVVIRVYAAAVNPLDWKVRSGALREWLPHKLPLIPGWDVSGIVESAGAGVETPRAGDQVFARLDTLRDGAYAEYVATDASIIARKPVSVDHVQAASVPLAGLTAWQAMYEAGQLKPGERILVHGAGGSVGGYAVQFAKLKGAHVIAAAKGAAREHASALGADEVVDYDAGPFEESVSDVDVVIDVIGGDIQERSLMVLKRGGILVSTVGIDVAEEAEHRGIETKDFFVRSDREQLAEIAKLVDAGKLKLNIGTVLPLAKAREAHELAESGRAKGKFILKVSD